MSPLFELKSMLIAAISQVHYFADTSKQHPPLHPFPRPKTNNLSIGCFAIRNCRLEHQDRTLVKYVHVLLISSRLIRTCWTDVFRWLLRTWINAQPCFVLIPINMKYMWCVRTGVYVTTKLKILSSGLVSRYMESQAEVDCILSAV